MPIADYFPNWDWNRTTFPDRHVVVCEDNLGQQSRAAALFRDVFGDQGRVQVSFVPGALQAACVMVYGKVDLVVLDHDMPNGNGQNLLDWMVSHSYTDIPVITFSGIDENNRRMSVASASHFKFFRVFNKEQVLRGEANSAIREALLT